MIPPMPMAKQRIPMAKKSMPTILCSEKLARLLGRPDCTPPLLLGRGNQCWESQGGYLRPSRITRWTLCHNISIRIVTAQLLQWRVQVMGICWKLQVLQVVRQTFCQIYSQPWRLLTTSAGSVVESSGTSDRAESETGFKSNSLPRVEADHNLKTSRKPNKTSLPANHVPLTFHQTRQQ